ncbi:type VI secretion system ImpG/VasA family protein [Bacterioplanes sanyensis]|uniref:Type VI secretion system ImpG/VasA family protein n=1 Tax=Bacterioplanes sanyensis TaxID=1249553 RepID=A0A222FLC2_9GAMM|nr:type VI secretion system baseplate subunit TssF [Bacterioplanes sanyensis]ASP39825.1 type VI secretion system ImpG/VasA family protein [Bacterioplanes sanyensis]
MSADIRNFQQELTAMRQSVAAFSDAYPAVASELRLSAGHSADPHVEQLLQSFAWLTARLRSDMERQRYETPNHLLLSLYPNLMRSVPSMAIMQANVLSDGASFINGYQLEKGRIFSAQSKSRRLGESLDQKSVECRMQCCYDTPLWPFEITDIATKPKNLFPYLDQRANVQGVVSIRIRSNGTDPIYEYPLERLRFFINSPELRAPLHQLLSNNFGGAALRVGEQFIPLTDANINWVGFDAEQNVLPQPLGSHEGYRLLQEYFYFPEKYYFFELSGIEAQHITDEFELLLFLERTDLLPAIHPNSLSINSFPVINLFPATFKPVQLDHSRYEYRLLADESQYGQSEVHSVNEVKILSADGTVRRAEAWLGGDGACSPAQQLRYLTRLVAPISPSTQGCDTMVALQDQQLKPAMPVDQTLSAKGLCSNRNLGESLRVGDRMQLVGAGAMQHAQLVTRPTLFKPARLVGESMVQLLSQLHLNLRSLVNGSSDEVLQRLRQLLFLHSDPMNPSHNKQINGIVAIEARSSVKCLGPDAWRGHFRGTQLALTLDENGFDGADPLLLGETLSHFLGLYTTPNHFTQLTLFSYQREGVWKQWHPRIGEQVIL